MMGTKERHFAPLIHVSLEELVCFRDLEGLAPLAGNAIQIRRISRKEEFFKWKEGCQRCFRWKQEKARLTTRGQKRKRRAGSSVLGSRRSASRRACKRGNSLASTMANS